MRDTDKIYQQSAGAIYNFIRSFQWMKQKQDDRDALFGGTIAEWDDQNLDRYNAVVKQCNDMLYEMTWHIIDELLKEYHIGHYTIAIKKTALSGYTFTTDGTRYNEESKDIFYRDIAGIIVGEDIWILKRCGIYEQFNTAAFRNALMEQCGVNHIKYLSMVHKDAWREVLNADKTSSEPSKGTYVYSMQQFFDMFFGKNEFEKFDKCCSDLVQKLKSHFALSVVHTPRTSTLRQMKNMVMNQIMNFPYQALTHELSSDQFRMIYHHYIQEETCRILIGSSSAAQCFITSEWMYHSLRHDVDLNSEDTTAGIDLTAVSMGYFKAAEQLLYGFIRLHADDGHYRQIRMKNNRMQRVTREFMDSPESKRTLTLGVLAGFFGFNPTDRPVIRRNTDLLNDGISDETYYFIVKMFNSLSELRNGYFHKDNMSNWKEVENDRKKVFIMFFLLLGAYKLSKDDRKALGEQISEADGSYKLMEFINRISDPSLSDDPLHLMVIYLDNAATVYVPVMDKGISYTSDGTPVYSGIYLHELGKHEDIFFDKEHLPDKVSIGYIRLSNSLPLSCSVGKPEKVIFENRKFMQ